MPVAEPLLSRGHVVIYHGDVLVSGAKDEDVARAAILNQAVLIAVDPDFKRMVKRFGSPNLSERYSKLNLIFINCKPELAPKRLEHAMSFIENEWDVTCEKVARRLWVDIGPHYLRSYR